MGVVGYLTVTVFVVVIDDKDGERGKPRGRSTVSGGFSQYFS